MPALASSYVASECPIDVMIPISWSGAMAESAPGSSGASVMSFMGDGEVMFEEP
jgi:hypothetical protein